MTLFLAGIALFVLLAATLARAVSDYSARRERQSLDIAWLMAMLLLSSFVPKPVPFAGVIKFAAVGLVPLLTLRLIGHFRPVSRLPGWAAAVFAMLGLFVGAVFGYDPSLTVRALLAAGWAAAWTAAGLLVVFEAVRSTGGRRRRAALMASGLLIHAATSSMVVVLHFAGRTPGRNLYQSMVVADVAAAVCLYLAFATPRFLTTRWRRAEQGAYLAQVVDREPEERGRHAPDDLLAGARACVGGALAFVALAGDPDQDELRIATSSDRTLLGRPISLGTGLLNRVRRTGVAQLGYPADCEPEVASAVADAGRLILAAPVASSSSWGVVVAVHRRGALFPEDDLSALAQLGRNAATALEHAALIVERRDLARAVAESQLRELESRVDLMVDSIKDYAMCVLTADGMVAAWHMGAQHVFGHTRDQIAAQSGALLFDLSDQEFHGWLREAAVTGFAQRESVCRRFDGQTFTGITTIRPLQPAPGGPAGFAVVTHDVTERRGLEDRLRQGQKMQAIGQLAGGVAHDFNNLLTAILGYADWLEQDLSGDRRVSQVIEIQRAAERAADLTRRLLAFSRKQMVQPASIVLGRLVADLVPMLQRLIGDRIRIVDVSSPLTSPVMGDRSQVEQIVLNLVLNARDAMPTGGEITIVTGDVWSDRHAGPSGVAGPQVLLEVRDTGLGMDAETQRRAFEPFFTTKDVGRGTGLGLSTVYGIVQQMGGTIEIESAPGRGATFRLFFPHASATPLSATLPEPSGDLIGRETVLLVEDDGLLRGYLTQVLECNGYRVMAAQDSEQALNLADTCGEPVDLVISDVSMPGRSGPELVAELVRRRPGLPALYISGHVEGILARFGAPASSTHLLQKPFSSTDLLTKVREILTAA